MEMVLFVWSLQIRGEAEVGKHTRGTTSIIGFIVQLIISLKKHLS